MRPSAGGQGDAQSGAQTGIMQPQGLVSSYLSSLGPNTPTTSQEMLQTADSTADDLLGLPNSLRSSDLRKLNNLQRRLARHGRARMDAKREEMAQAVQQQSLAASAAGAPTISGSRRAPYWYKASPQILGTAPKSFCGC